MPSVPISSKTHDAIANIPNECAGVIALTLAGWMGDDRAMMPTR
jgi:hypothetical protein